MVGIASSLKCENCRQRKKKCDMLKPACSRCVRIGVTCIGSGQQRFVFVNSNVKLDDPSIPSNTSSAPSATSERLPASLSDHLIATRSSLFAVMETSDVRYDLSMYGGFMKDIPVRLGSNEALDAAAKALVHSYIAFRRRTQSLECVQSYSLALTELRTSLDDPNRLSSIDTVVSIYLLMLCQALMGDSMLTVHGEGLSHLFNAPRTRLSFRGDRFSHEILLTLCLPVVVASIAKPHIQLQPWLDDLCKEYNEAMQVHCLRFTQIAKLREFAHNPIPHEKDIRESYQRTAMEMLKFQEGLRSSQCTLNPILRIRLQNMYSVALSYAIILNTIIARTFEPLSPVVAEESGTLLDEIIALAYNAAEYIPIATSAMPIMLIAAWPCDAARRPEIEDLVALYTDELRLTGWRDSAMWLDATLSGPAFDSDGDPQTRPLPDSGACCVM